MGERVITMAIGLVGRKVGMTRIFTEDGTSIPVTVIEATPNRVTQLRTEETDGYRALQVTAGTKKANRVNKAEAGHFAKAGVEAGRTLVEFRLEDNEGAEIEVGSEITVEIFNDTKKIDVTGTSKGKGFKGKKMAGQLGNKQVTTQSLEVVRVDVENNLILVKGAVPGATGNDVIVKPAVKA